MDEEDNTDQYDFDSSDVYNECPNCGGGNYSAFRGFCEDCYYDEITGNPGVKY